MKLSAAAFASGSRRAEKGFRFSSSDPFLEITAYVINYYIHIRDFCQTDPELWKPEEKRE